MRSSKLGTNNSASDDRQHLFRIARTLLAFAFLLFGLATYYLWSQYLYTRPSFMDQDSGHIHALYAEGWTVYLTRADQFRLYGLVVAAVACLVGAVALDVFRPDKKG
jgi:hypothetical protein